MPRAKTTDFSPAHQELAKVAQALAHPARLAILTLMSDRKRRLSGEISNAFPLPRTTISQHLTVLRKSGLLRAQSEGLTMTYWLDQTVAQTGLRRLASYGISIITCPVCLVGNGCGCVSDRT
jgi:DNA-binding transcriptional ArsR family regulator